MRSKPALAVAMLIAACSPVPAAAPDEIRPGLWEYEGFISSIERPIGAEPRMREQLPEYMRQSRTLRGCVTEREARDFVGQARVSGFMNERQASVMQIRDHVFGGGMIRVRATWDVPEDSSGEARAEGHFTETTLEARIISEERIGARTNQPGRTIIELRGHRLGECPGNGR